jgi:hypothetical protein
VRPLSQSPFLVLSRTFFDRFFASETVSSDMRLRQTMIWVLAFLLTPGLTLMVMLFPAFQTIVVRARRFNSPGMIDDWLEYIVFMFVVYSMVTIGLIAAFVWDALDFEHRDAMVLGPVPLRARTIVGAKIAALGVLLAMAAIPVNAVNAFFFATETADQFGARTFVVHFVAFFTATVLAAVFVFATVVAIRGAVATVAGPARAAAIGTLLQFVFLVLLLSCMFLSPALWKIPNGALNNNDTMGWFPTSWFVGLFERLRGSTRPYFIPLGVRALVATPIAIVTAVVVSMFSFNRAMQHAVSRAGAAGGLVARAARAARVIAGRHPIARVTADFVLLTIARNRSVHTPIVMNAALGVALAIAGLTRARTFANLTGPRTIVLWMPLLVGYWLTIGLRAATFVPSEPRASWIFSAAGIGQRRAFWSGTRAAFLTIVLPSALVVTGTAIAPLLGWRLALWHAAFVVVILTATVDAVLLTIPHVPFTAIYRPGHARLRTRWPLYGLGMFAVAVWAIKIELLFLGGSELRLVAGAAVVAALLYIAGRVRAAPGLPITPDDVDAQDEDEATVLNIGQVAPASTAEP